jgi:hypothetical protein
MKGNTVGTLIALSLNGIAAFPVRANDAHEAYSRGVYATAN